MAGIDGKNNFIIVYFYHGQSDFKLKNDNIAILPAYL